MNRLTRDGTAEPVSRDQILRHARGQGNVHFPCSADHEQDLQPYPVDPYSAICDDHTNTSVQHVHPRCVTLLTILATCSSGRASDGGGFPRYYGGVREGRPLAGVHRDPPEHACKRTAASGRTKHARGRDTRPA